MAITVSSFQTENNGRLPGASDLKTSNFTQISSVKSEGMPTTSAAVYKVGANCDGASSARNYAITILLEDGSAYCQGS